MPKSGREGGRECELSLVECLACFMYDLFYDLHICLIYLTENIHGGEKKGQTKNGLKTELGKLGE